MNIAILIPCYNEGGTIARVVKDFRKQLPTATVYVYDNNSNDSSRDEALRAGAIVRSEARQGKGYVVQAMFRDIEADIYVLVDGDDTYPAENVLTLVEAVQDGADMVIGDRFTNGRYEQENRRSFHVFGNRLVKTLVSHLFYGRLNDVMSGYRVFSRKFVKKYPALVGGFQVEVDMTIFALKNKFSVKEIPVVYRDRSLGSVSKLHTLTDGCKVLFTIFTLSNIPKIIKRILYGGLKSFPALFAIFLFAKRGVFPDMTFDTMNYHFLLGKRGWENFPLSFRADEFYPLGIHSFHPLFDMMHYAMYIVLGYRLGTVLSLLSLVGTFYFLWKLLRYMFHQTGIWKYDTIFILIFIPFLVVKESFFQIATYLTDNLYVFVTVYYLWKLVVLQKEKQVIAMKNIFLFGVLFGLLATKLTNIIYLLPFAFYTAKLIMRHDSTHTIESVDRRTWLLKKAIVFLVPILLINCTWISNLIMTKNPIFPYFNGLFHSIYYPFENWQFNVGPKNIPERLFFFWYALDNPRLLGEVEEVYPDAKIISLFIFIVTYLFIFGRQRVQRFTEVEKMLVYIYLSAYVLWQVQWGYTRYAIALEFLGGLLVILLLRRSFQEKKFFVLKLFATAYIFSVCLTATQTLQVNFSHDLSLREIKSFSEWETTLRNTPLFSHHTIITQDASNIFSQSDLVIQCINPSAGYFATIQEANNLPVININLDNDINLSLNNQYTQKRDENFIRIHGEEAVRYVSVIDHRDGGVSASQIRDCTSALRASSASISSIVYTDNFVGDTKKSLVIISGTLVMKQNK